MRPGETDNLLLVSLVGGDNVLLKTNVVVEDDRVAASRRDQISIPGEGRNAASVTRHGTKQPVLVHVPELNLVLLRTNGEPLSTVGPLDRGDLDTSRALAQVHNLSSLGGPNVDSRAKTDGDTVVRRPVEQVKVVVINKLGSVEGALGEGRNVTSATDLLLGRGERLRVEDAKTVLIASAGLRGLRLASEDAARLDRGGREHRLGERSRQLEVAGRRTFILLRKVVLGDGHVDRVASRDETVASGSRRSFDGHDEKKLKKGKKRGGKSGKR